MKTIDQTVEILDNEQQRIVTAVRSQGERTWTDGHLVDTAHGSLAGRGHFRTEPDELTFTVQEVAGHLADSATVFAARIKVIREMDLPSFGDFTTTDPDRRARYREVSFSDALDRLVWTYQHLRAQVVQIGVDDFERQGLHEHRGEISIASIVEFLPQHLSDHLAQLRALSVSASA
ncbi:MAG: DinB family protein [Acidimicrobiia bacterium]|nr:DinB family protein [Acidimicrobiia bacterium]MDH5236549.1 DinB family protein [Acidimicrobiia bacterium]